MKYLLSRITLLLSLLLLGLPTLSLAGHPPTEGGSLAPLLKQAMPSVVNVMASGKLPFDPEAMAERDEQKEHAGHPPLLQKPHKFHSIGSAVIVDAKRGYLLTNAHVIRHADRITVTLNDGRRVKAKLIGADKMTDVAVLQIPTKNLHAITLGDSSHLQVGDYVIAIGNPFGLNLYGSNQTATYGIVSALQRHDLRIEGMENFIQTDAAINPGNSGGALIDLKGRLIGINTAIISPDGGGSVGIGFAIPSNMAQAVMSQLIKFGSVHRGVMGVFVQNLTPELAEAFSIKNTQGALVTQVNPGSPAEAAGLLAGDLITAINGKAVTSSSQVKNRVGLQRVGTNLHMVVTRHGKSLTLSAKIADTKQHVASQQAENPFLFGLALRDFDEDSPMHGHVRGVQIVAESENSPAWSANLRPGDVIIAANQKPLQSIQDLREIAEGTHDHLLVHILRGGGSLFLVIK